MNTPFLDPAEIRRNCAEANLNDDATQTFLEFAARIQANPALLAAANAAHHGLFETNDERAEISKHAEAAFGDDASLFRALLVLDSIRLIREKQAARGVPPEITRAVMEHQPIATLRGSIDADGRISVGDSMWWWYRTVGSGDLYSLGRLEFIPEAFDYSFRVFVNDDTGETIALLNPGQSFTDEGILHTPTTWTSTLSETETALIGNPISPRGIAIRSLVELPRQSWRQALGPGDIVLDMHIPGNVPLTLESIRDALEQACPFFDRFYPGKPFTAFVCDSWLFSTQIEGMLPPESNILRWQREGYLYNQWPSQDMLTFTFGSSTIDLATAPRDTRLRRAIIAHLERGGELRGGGYLLLRADLPRFGTQPYRVASEQAIARLVQ